MVGEGEAEGEAEGVVEGVAEGEEVVLAVTVPHWIYSVFGHQLEQKSERGSFQDSLETWGFSRY